MSKSKTKNILFLMSGSIAAYKSCALISKLVQQKYAVQVVASEAALKFVGPATIEGLTGAPVLTDAFAVGHAMDHIHLARWADLILLCPGTANTINQMACGIGDTLLTSLFLAHDFTKPFLVAPAMNAAMYSHPITQASIKKLSDLGLRFLKTGQGTLACGEVGAGRLLEPEEIFKAIQEELVSIDSSPMMGRESHPLAPKRSRVLITSGGTIEPIDAMRVITNLSSGKTGATLADIFFDLGYDVDFLGSESGVRPSRPCKIVSFSTFEDLNSKLVNLLATTNYLSVIHAAAVSDFHVTRIHAGDSIISSATGKLPSSKKLLIELEPNFKILPRLKTYVDGMKPLVIGFKFTATASPESRLDAVQKLFSEGGVDWVVHNDLSEIDKSKNIHSFTLHSITKSLPIPNTISLAEALTERMENHRENLNYSYEENQK